MSKIAVSKPYLDSKERKAVMDVLKSGMLAQGPKVAELEKRFAEKVGTKYCVALNSGTAALHAGLYGLNVQAGDEVITTPFTFVASANPAIMLGAKPIFVDVDEKTFNIDPNLIKEKITEKTKAILPIHLYGRCSDMDAINKIAKEHNLVVLEDACQAHNAKYKEKYAGNLGDAGAFSLYATKNMMSGEGGLLTTNSEEVMDRAKRFRQHGMKQSGDYAYVDLGYNYRLTDVLASIALVQLDRLDKFTQKRQKNAKYLLKALKGIKGLILPDIDKDYEPCWHQFTIRITTEYPISRDEFVAKLKEQEIFSGIYYPKPLHLHPQFQKLGYKEGDFPVSEKLAKEVVSLPVHPLLTKENLDRMIGVIKAIR